MLGEYSHDDDMLDTVTLLQPIHNGASTSPDTDWLALLDCFPQLCNLLLVCTLSLEEAAVSTETATGAAAHTGQSQGLAG